MLTPILETKRLILKPATLDECAALQVLFSDYNVVQYMTGNIAWPQPADGSYTYTRDVVIPDMEKGLIHSWTLYIKETNAPVGRISLRYSGPIESEHRGYWIGAPYHGKGYMSEAMAATANLGFNVMGMTSMTSKIADANIGSTKLLQASGATAIHKGVGNYVAGDLPETLWEVTPESWRTSPLKLKHG